MVGKENDNRGMEDENKLQRLLDGLICSRCWQYGDSNWEGHMFPLGSTADEPPFPLVWISKVSRLRAKDICINDDRILKLAKKTTMK